VVGAVSVSACGKKCI